jgi:hypothetical protein
MEELDGLGDAVLDAQTASRRPTPGASLSSGYKLMKYDFGDERLTKRGNKAFQARLDKTLLAMHLAVASP